MTNVSGVPTTTQTIRDIGATGASGSIWEHLGASMGEQCHIPDDAVKKKIICHFWLPFKGEMSPYF